MLEPLCLAPGAVPDPYSLGERRAAVRYPWNQEFSCHLVTADRHDARWARIQNLSASGVALLLARPFDPGTLLGVELHSLNQGFACTLPAEVLHASEQPDGSWLVGCAFVRGLALHELEALL